LSSDGTQYDVEITDRFEVTDYPKVRQPVQVVLVTYVAAGLSPSTVRILKAEFTPQLERERIKADIEARLKEKPTTFRV
jgi:hypothetical protein